MQRTLGALILGAFLSTNFLTAAMAAPMPLVKEITVLNNESGAKNQAKPHISSEEAKKIVAKLSLVPKGFKQESVQFEDNPNRKVWSFRWSKNENYKFYSISVSIDADTGQLRSFNKEDPSFWEPKYEFTSDFTRKQAREIAVKFIKKYNYDKFALLQEEETPYNDLYYGSGKRPMQRYNFRFARIVKGIPFEEDGAWIDVLENGEVANYNLNWSKFQPETTSAKITLEEGKKIFKENLGLQLTYVKDYSKPRTTPGEPTETKLVYQVPDYMNFYIDAQTGEVKDFGGVIYTEKHLASLDKKEQAADGGKFYIDNNKLAKEDALEVARQKFEIPEGYTLTATEFMQDYFSGRPIWTFRYSKEQQDKKGFNLEIAVAADNGEIFRMNKYRNYPIEPADKDATKLTYEEGIAKAKEFINRVIPEKAQYVRIDPQSPSALESEKLMPIYERYYHFTRYVNNIAVAGEGIGISIDPVTGEILNFNQQFSQAEFKSPQNVMDIEKVYKKFFDQAGIKLSFFRIFKPRIEYGMRQGDIVLGYRLKQDFIRQFDAITGEPLNNGMPKPPTKLAYTKDIEKHKYEKAIKKLFDLNIMGGRTKTAFYPDKTITQAEFIKAVVTAKGFAPIYDKSKLPFKNTSLSAWYAPYVRTAIAQGLLTKTDKFNPSTPVTLEEASIIAVRALGYDKVAKLGIFKQPSFKASKVNYGYAAITDGFHILPDKTDNTLSRGEAAQTIVNILKIGSKN